ncbi:MAG: hypothetical protein K2L78_08550, partial [Muribaculaceae bacterium]|nr:hypothetical protein [Muribaculaceae bacterium]
NGKTTTDAQSEVTSTDRNTGNTCPSQNISAEMHASAPPSTENPVTGSTQNISLRTLANKHITNIVVFYSDNSFQSFYPDFPTQQQPN